MVYITIQDEKEVEERFKGKGGYKDVIAKY
jgi:hypothetical protein